MNSDMFRRNAVLCCAIIALLVVGAVITFRPSRQRLGAPALAAGNGSTVEPAPALPPKNEPGEAQKSLFKDAEAAYRAKDYAKALELFDKLLADCADPAFCQRAMQLRTYALMQSG